MSAHRHRKSLNIPGHAHELTFSCYKRFPFLSRERTRRWLAEAIDAARREHDFALWAYVVVPDHAHLLLFPRGAEHNVSAMLAAIKEPVGRRALRRSGASRRGGLIASPAVTRSLPPPLHWLRARLTGRD